MASAHSAHVTIPRRRAAPAAGAAEVTAMALAPPLTSETAASSGGRSAGSVLGVRPGNVTDSGTAAPFG
jgi:hypothetical protein